MRDAPNTEVVCQTIHWPREQPPPILLGPASIKRRPAEPAHDPKRQCNTRSGPQRWSRSPTLEERLARQICMSLATQYGPTWQVGSLHDRLFAPAACYCFVRAAKLFRVSEFRTLSLYVSHRFGTLRRGAVAAAAQCAGVARPLERVARAVRSVLHARRATRAFRRYLLGLLNDSRRKSMTAMLDASPIRGRIKRSSIITHAPRRAERPGDSCER